MTEEMTELLGVILADLKREHWRSIYKGEPWDVLTMLRIVFEVLDSKFSQEEMRRRES